MAFTGMLNPLDKVEDLLRLLGYMKVVPNSVKNRTEHLTQMMNSMKEGNSKITVQEMSVLLQTLENLMPMYGDNPCQITTSKVEDECTKYMEQGCMDIGSVNIIPPITKCCGQLKNFSTKACTLYRVKDKPVIACMHDMKCMKCKTVYKTSTYKRDGKDEIYYDNVLTLPYFMSTIDTVFSSEFMSAVDADM